MAPHKAKHDIFLNETRTRVVPGGDKDAKFLVARAGAEIPPHIADKHGIIEGALVNQAEAGASIPDLSVPRNNVAPEGIAARRGPGRPPTTRDA